MSETMPRSTYGSNGAEEPFRAGPRPLPRRRPRGERWDVLAVISLGGALGALARYGLGQLIRSGNGGFPWATFSINVTGCLVIGVFMVAITEAFPAHRLLRPFLGVGVLGGYTTFSTYVVDGIHLVMAGEYRVAVLYIACSVLACLLAVVLGALGMRRGFHWFKRRTDHTTTGEY